MKTLEERASESFNRWLRDGEWAQLDQREQYEQAYKRGWRAARDEAIRVLTEVES